MLELKNITKSYITKDYVQNALNEVSITFRKNEFASILGASGSGKTTMLNIIGGLDQYNSGDLIIEGVSTRKYKSTDWDTYRNNRVGFVFQSYNLIPHQTVLSNVELALTLSGVSAKERKQRAIEALDEVGLIEHITKLPTQLSGGQMQRVAIARALINDPEIVLADEPTGALDSTTSDQVMELLEEIAKDRLVIMVTHNPELAEKYTNRIIELKDGEVIGDTNPHIVDIDSQPFVTKASKKTKMSFLTAISLSVSNLMTKKGRTFITAVAGSIGIIGIATILALASGINLYIEGIEQDTMSAYPLTVDSSGIDITSFLGGNDSPSDPVEKPILKDDEVPVLNTISSLFSFQNKNDLKSFKDYVEKNRDNIDPYVKNIQYKYGITPQIYLKDKTANLRQVNPDTIFSSYGFGSPAGLDLISGAGDFGMKNFSELPGENELFLQQYDVIKGRWPQAKNELIVVLLDSGSLTDTTIYTLGLKDRNALEKMFEKFLGEEDLNLEMNKNEVVDYDKIMAQSFKLVNPAEKYTYDKSFDLWVDNSEDTDYMDKVINAGMDLNVVGIVKANADTKTPMLSSGIYYPQDLTTYLIEEASQYDIVKQQLENKEINVFTGKRIDATEEFAPSEIFKLDDFISIDQDMILNSFSFDTSALNIDLLDFDINFDQIQLPEFDLESLAESLSPQINVPVDDILAILTSLVQEFIGQQNDLNITSLQEWVIDFNDYIRSAAVQEELNRAFELLNSNSQINQNTTEIITNFFNTYVTTAFDQISNTVLKDFTAQIQSKLGELSSNALNAFTVDTNALANAFQFNIKEDEIFNLIRSLGERSQVSQSSNLTALGYRDIAEPVQINLYPKDFTTKEGVVDFIDVYNVEMTNTNQTEKVVKYTDFVAAILSSVTTIISTISYALIAFVAISLVVSSIMIGVITYVSVLERIKEIGILRAIGASKKDIRRVFNAETMIIGFIAGSFGIFITYIISFFANIIIYNEFKIPNIAHLDSEAAIILIVISMFLAFVSGLIPSSTAAKKDPVEALRSE